MVVHLQHWPVYVVAWLTLKHQMFMWTLSSFIYQNTSIEFVCQRHKNFVVLYTGARFGLVCNINFGSVGAYAFSGVLLSCYSRQRYVLGDSAMHQMALSSVFLSGIGGLGVEIGKLL